MELRKRKLPQAGLQRRVRARAEPEPDLGGFEDETSSGGPSEEEADESGSDSGSGSGSGSGSESAGDSDEDEGASEDEEAGGAPVDASKVSFGALAKAQAVLGRRKKKKADESGDGPAGDEDAPARQGYTHAKIEKPPSRSSKHAPMEMSSKRQVSRKREIIPVKKTQYRDPRFDPLVTGRAIKTTADEDRARKAYAFLDEYRDDEMRRVRAAIKKAKTPAEKEELQRALMSMESRKKAREKRDKERAVVEEHRRSEKELVKEGKKAKPFYLKKSEQKKRLLVDQFTGLSERQRDKVIEKKRKKIAGKEKKQLPMERRARE